MPNYLTAFLAAVLLLSPLTAQAAAAATQIAVSGRGTITLPPDVVSVNATVETYDGHSASTAVGDNAAIYDRVVSAIVALGVSRADIILSSYDVTYNPPPDERSGYTVDRSFTVKTARLDLAGKIVDAETTAGATRIDGVYFGLADASATARQAMQRAVADATAQASALAAAAHLHIVGIATIAANGGYIPTPQPLMHAAMATAPTTFEPGTTTVTRTVNMVFLAKP